MSKPTVRDRHATRAANEPRRSAVIHDLERPGDGLR